MIGKEDEEEVHYKVADRRKFNSDGSLREGVVIEPAKPAAPPPASEPLPAGSPLQQQQQESPSPQPVDSSESGAYDFAADEGAELEDEGDDGEIPGADNPSSFINFLSTLATNAAAALGAVPHPATGQRSLDLESGKYWLEILAMLRDKTKNNLHPQEARLLEGLLGDLRMQYVQIMRASEEKLKAHAARKFSTEDILGKK